MESAILEQCMNAINDMKTNIDGEQEIKITDLEDKVNTLAEEKKRL
jgi:hypothetical protein